jgi:hypothetical protein
MPLSRSAVDVGTSSSVDCSKFSHFHAGEGKVVILDCETFKLPQGLDEAYQKWNANSQIDGLRLKGAC